MTERAPSVDGGARAHDLAEQRRARRRRRLRIGPGGDVAPVHPEPFEKRLQAELGVRFVQRRPAVVVEAAVEAGKKRQPPGQAGDDLHQLGDGRNAARRTGDDHRRCRGRGAPAPGERFENPHPARGGVHEPALGEDLRPAPSDDGEELQGLAPMFRQIVGNQRFESGETDLRGLHLVEQPRQRARQRHRLGAGNLPPPRRPRAHQFGEQQTTFETADSRRRGDLRVVEAVALLVVEVAERLDARE